MSKIKQLIIAGIEPVKSEHYNSNNAWGFGGARGEKYYYPSGAVILVGYAGTRHQGDFPFHTVTDKDGRCKVDRSGIKVDINDEVIQRIIKTGL
jgi:hypothetical protein